MNSKKIRPIESPRIEDGIYEGTIVGAYEKVFKSQYNPSGQQDFLSLRVRVDHRRGVYFLFYNVTWDWNYYRFCQLLDDMEVMPEPGTEFSPERLVGKNVTIVVENQVSQGRNFTNIVELKPQDVASVHGMNGDQWSGQDQGGEG